MTLTADRDLIDGFAGWSRHVGWRVDGWASLAALGRLRRPATGTRLLDGPTHAGGVRCDVAAGQLSCLSDAGWGRVGERDTVQGRQFWLSHPDREEYLHLVLRQRRWTVAAVQTAPPHLLRIPPLGLLLARRLQLIVTLDRRSPAWSRAVIDAAALVHHPDVQPGNRYVTSVDGETLTGAAAKLDALDAATLADLAPGRCRQLTDGIGQLLQLSPVR